MRSHFTHIFLALLIATVFYKEIPQDIQQGFLSLSLFIKEVLMALIPFIIFTSVYNGFTKMRKAGMMLIFLLIGCVIASNFLSVNIAGTLSYFAIFGSKNYLHEAIQGNPLTPLWEVHIPVLIPNNIALLISFTLAFLYSPFLSPKIDYFSQKLGGFLDFFLKKVFTPLLPFFIFGFVLKLLHDDLGGDILWNNSHEMMLMLMLLICYLFFIYAVAVIFYGNKSITLIDPAIAAFTTMSSAAALPFSIKAAELNTGDKELADIVMPTTVNIHMIGDSLCIPILAMMTLSAFNQPMPSFETYLLFAATFTWTKFSGAGLPGGTIFVMIPVLESILHFTPEMSALITLLYILIDPIATTGNVVGNNLFVIHFQKAYRRLVRL